MTAAAGAAAAAAVGELAAELIRLAIRWIGREGVQAILDAEYDAADRAADALEAAKFGGVGAPLATAPTEPAPAPSTTAPETPDAKKKGTTP